MAAVPIQFQEINVQDDYKPSSNDNAIRCGKQPYIISKIFAVLYENSVSDMPPEAAALATSLTATLTRCLLAVQMRKHNANANGVRCSMLQ